MNIDWKLWLAVGGLSLALLGSFTELFVCHFIPSVTGRATCGVVASAIKTVGQDATEVGNALPGDEDAGLALPAILP